MAQKKISQLPQDTSPTVTDSIPTYDVETNLTKRATLADLITLFFNNIPTGAHSDVTRGAETIFDHVVQNTGVWTADSVGVNRNASMTALTCYINGRRITISAVTARTFSASLDTYIDVLDNQDGTGTLVYTTAANNAASPALAANSIRIGIIVAGATTIATTASINQGQHDRVLPIASTIPYTVTDSLGNLICSRDPRRVTLGFRQILGNVSYNGTATDILGLSATVNVPAGRKVKISVNVRGYGSNVAADRFETFIQEGATVLGSVGGYITTGTGSIDANGNPWTEFTPTSGVHTYKVVCQRVTGTGTGVFFAAAADPSLFVIELV